MANPHGTPIWYELMSDDPAAAGAFYSKVLGWTVGSFGQNMAGDAYQVFTAPDGQGVGGMMKRPDPGPRPGWFGYIGVDDVDATAASIKDAGGAIHMGPNDLPGVGRLAMVGDPQGVIFYIMRGSSPEASHAFERMALGHGDWNELSTSDDEAALAFYGQIFGWKKDGALPMGALGEYSFLSHDGGMIGAVMKAQPGNPTMWHYFFRTGNIDDAKRRVEEAGGTIVAGPMEVPGGDYVIYVQDPQGARFGLVGSR